MKTPGTVVAVLVVVTASFFLLGGENTVVPARALAADVDGQYVRKAAAASHLPARDRERPTDGVGLDRVAIIALVRTPGASHGGGPPPSPPHGQAAWPAPEESR